MFCLCFLHLFKSSSLTLTFPLRKLRNSSEQASISPGVAMFTSCFRFFGDFPCLLIKDTKSEWLCNFECFGRALILAFSRSRFSSPKAIYSIRNTFCTGQVMFVRNWRTRGPVPKTARYPYGSLVACSNIFKKSCGLDGDTFCPTSLGTV